MRWFSPKALRDLDVVMQYILRERPPALRNLMRLSVSNILRRVSWQKEDDLRVRREVRDTEPDVFGEFADELLRAVRLVLALRYQEGARKLGGARVTDVDARQLDSRWRAWRRSVDAVVTSPPYATALPYLDTDRLSLSYLGLLPRSMHRRQDQLMIGNREITEKTRRLYWERYETEKSQLPERVTDLIAAIDTLNHASNVGFRRRNLSALLGKYFLDMRTVLRGIHGLLKPAAHAFVVVGDNHTVAGGRRVEIKTAQLLADVAGSVGFRVDDLVPMEMLVSRDIFRRNAVGSEWIVCLRR
jgi:site-specific DNA-methyltransferase (cytosine-N4-specific)